MIELSFLYKIFFVNLFFILLIFVLSKLAAKIGLIDYPGLRKIHKIPTPVIGGIAVFIILLFSKFIFNFPNKINIIIYSSFFITLVGILDDIFNIKAITRLFLQLIIATFVVYYGFQIISLGSFFNFQYLYLEKYGFIFSVLCIVCLINAINFSDGIDGITTVIFINALISIILFSGKIISNDFLIIYILLCISLLFLLFNLGLIKNFKVFLGDSGSNLIGFLLAGFLIFYSQNKVNVIDPLNTIWCVALPVFDFFRIFLYRIMKLRSPFYPDNNHIHHILIKRGYSMKKSFFLLSFISIFINLLGINITFIFGKDYALIFFIFLFFFYAFFVNYLSKNENFY